MIGTRRALIHSEDIYVRRVLATGPIAYWPLNERTGSVAYDVSGYGRHGAYSSAVQIGHLGIGDGGNAPYFDGTTGTVNLYSAGLAAAFNAAEGSAMVWLRAGTDSVWSAATSRYVTYLRSDAANRTFIQRDATIARHLRVFYIAGGTTKFINLARLDTLIGATLWGSFIWTWSSIGDSLSAYFMGTPYGTPASGLGSWAGTLDSDNTLLGASKVSAPTVPWLGDLAHSAVWDRVLTTAEAGALGTIQ